MTAFSFPEHSVNKSFGDRFGGRNLSALFEASDLLSSAIAS